MKQLLINPIEGLLKGGPSKKMIHIEVIYKIYVVICAILPLRIITDTHCPTCEGGGDGVGGLYVPPSSSNGHSPNPLWWWR